MTRTRPRGPKVEMPRRPPPGSSTGPPSSRPVTQMSRVMRRSIRPPARLCQERPTEWMTPSRTDTPPSSAPKARASAPGCGSPAGIGAGSGVPSTWNADDIGAGIAAGNARREGRFRRQMSPWPRRASGNVCSEATTTSLAPERSGTHPVPRHGDAATRGRASVRALGQRFGQLGQRILNNIGHGHFSSSRWSGEWSRSRPEPPGGWGGPAPVEWPGTGPADGLVAAIPEVAAAKC